MFTVIRKLLSKKLKPKQVFEPAVMISVMRNSVLSDSIFFALLMAKLEKMAMIPDKPFWFEILSGIWIAYQAYTTWNNAIFYLFISALFSYDVNSWLRYSIKNSDLRLTKAATRRKFDLSMRIYRILQLLNTQYNNCNRIFIMFGHKVVMGGCQVAALYGIFRLFSRLNLFSYVMLPMTVTVTLSVETVVYGLFGLNQTLSKRLILSWRGCGNLEPIQQKTLSSCKILQIKVWGLYCYQRNTILRVISCLLNQNILLGLLS
ncbi:unnamed protein product [Allacma fusca]|uniref:Uncharacterized protein n=1 Tax=Allacma fusca TaxID=39272 RepID=A0A8J2JEZ8_9HEXA|nr:unnamed protein product [Allacma fusca]